MKYRCSMCLAIATLAGCQAQSKPPASATTPTVLDVAAPRTQHQPSVYAMPAAMPASYAGTSAAPAASANVPAYLPPQGSTTSAPPVGLLPARRAQVASAQSARATIPKVRKTDGKTYLVKRGDTLFQIARDHCGSGAKWRQIAELNPGLTPANLKAGQKLLMP